MLCILVIIFCPILLVPFFYVLPKKVNPGWITSIIGLLQIILGSYTLLVVYQGTTCHQACSWFLLPHGLLVQIGIYVDLQSALWLVMITLISWISTLYSIAYLPHCTNKNRYFSLYNLSLTSMLWILVADNLWGMFVGWELMSITSCLLIGFWYQDAAAVYAGTYTWIMNKIGSICFLMGLLLVVIDVDHCDISQLTHINESWHHHNQSNHLYLAGCSFLIAVLTKSAQFPFSSWLPQSMVSPTPISALLHTATVLSAGIYLLIRIQPILHLNLNTLLIIIGHITAFMGASTALVQQHLKRMLAYSTLSHLGYIVATIGIGNTAIAVISFMVHCLAKACLFLMAGVIAHFLQFKGVSKQKTYTMSYMGGLWCKLPLTAISYVVAMCGLGIIPGLIGFTIKEQILTQTFAWANHSSGGLYNIIPPLALASHVLTILYLGRAFACIFLGNSKWQYLSPIGLASSKSTPNLRFMQGSMMLCTISILFVAYLFHKFFSPARGWETMHNVYIDQIIKIVSYGSLLVIGLWLVMRQFINTTWVTKVTPDSTWIPNGTSIRFKRAWVLYRLVLHGWYLDTCITFVGRQVMTCSKWALQVEKWFFHRLMHTLAVGYVIIAHMVQWLDRQLINAIDHTIAISFQRGSKLYLNLHNGRNRWYLVWMCIGMGLLITIWMLLIQ